MIYTSRKGGGEGGGQVLKQLQASPTYCVLGRCDVRAIGFLATAVCIEFLGGWGRYGIGPFCHLSPLCNCPLLFSWPSGLAMPELPPFHCGRSPSMSAPADAVCVRGGSPRHARVTPNLALLRDVEVTHGFAFCIAHPPSPITPPAIRSTIVCVRCMSGPPMYVVVLPCFYGASPM